MSWQLFHESVDVSLVLTEIDQLKKDRAFARDLDRLIGQNLNGNLLA